MLSGEQGVSQAFMERLYISGGYMDVSEVVVLYDCARCTSRTSILSTSGRESVSSCEVMLQVANDCDKI